jgi:uncharacterized protein YbaP (TraB family)
VDKRLWDAAKSAGKRPFLLESLEALRAYDSAPISEQISRLEMVVSDPDLIVRVFNRILAAWRVADTEALATELRAHLDKSPITFRALVQNRNNQWLPQIIAAIRRGKSAVFVVGALHLAGEHSLQRLLKPHGYDLIAI